MKKTKVLFLAKRYGPHIGGVETHLQQVSELLSAKNYQITIITEQDDPTLPTKEVMGGIEVWRISLPAGGSHKWLIWWWVVCHFYLFLNHDIIHMHDVFFWILPLYPFLRLWRRKIYITFHGYEAPGPLTPKQIRWHRLAARWTRANICVGHFHKKIYGVTPTVITYGGINISHPPKELPKTAVAFVGRLDTDTGIEQYLQAIANLKKQGESIHFDIFGDGPLRSKLEKLQDEQQLDVTFHGFVADARNYLRGYAVVFASQYLAILEAMSQGCAVIAYADSPIKKTYLTDTPFAEWITVANSVTEIMAALEQPKLMSKHGINWAKKQTWERLGQEYLDLWKK